MVLGEVQSPRRGRSQHVKLLALFVAITVCFLLYSLVQERLMTRPFGAEGERFKNSLFIILVNRVVTMAVAAATLGVTEHSIRPAAPILHFLVPSLANIVASTAQYEALKYVSFPLQALAKCAKTVPVMAWGLLIGGRSYSRSDYWCSALVTAGCTIFVLTGDIAAPSISALAAPAAAAAAAAATAEAAGGGAGRLLAEGLAAEPHWVLWGVGLLALFLLCDGLASTSQDRLYACYAMHSCNQLLWVTAWSAALALSGLVVSGQLAPALRFVRAHPSCLGFILALSALSTAAQLFIYYTIQHYGALRFALVMTVRQFMSIVLSCLVFAHHLSPEQWAGTTLVIGALVHRSWSRPSIKGGHPRQSSKPSTPVSGGNALPAPLNIPNIPVIQSQLKSPNAKRPAAPGSSPTPRGSASLTLSLDADGRALSQMPVQSVQLASNGGVPALMPSPSAGGAGRPLGEVGEGDGWALVSPQQGHAPLSARRHLACSPSPSPCM